MFFYIFPPSNTETIAHSTKFPKVIEACLKDSSTALDIIRSAELGFKPVLGIRDIWVWIRILGSVPLTNGSGRGRGSGRPENIRMWTRIRNTSTMCILNQIEKCE
jgi:hypothetical protein